MAETVQSVERAFKVLLAFDEDRASLSAAQIAAATNLTRPTTYRLLQTLQHIGLVRKSRGAFELTPLVLRLSSGYLGSHGLARRSQPVLDRLSEILGEHVSIAILDGHEVVSLAASNSPHSRHLAVAVQVGQRMPAAVTSLGRMLMAFTEPGRTRDPEEAADQERIRKLGYAISDGLLAPELRSVAVPVRDRGGNVVAGLASAAKATDVTIVRLEAEFVPQLIESAEELASMT